MSRKSSGVSGCEWYNSLHAKCREAFARSVKFGVMNPIEWHERGGELGRKFWKEAVRACKSEFCI